jgi:transcriptional regulator GlxA family with amidase domain
MTIAVGAPTAESGAPPRTRPATRQLRRAIFEDAVQILESEYARPIKVEEVARRVATSPRQLQRVFAEVGGYRAYLTRIRLSHAADLLTSSDVTVKQVAVRVGYKDISQFSKAFRRTYGVSASRFSAASRRSQSAASAAIQRAADSSGSGRTL